MAITLQRAKTLCRGSEFQVVLASTKKRVEGLTSQRLHEKRTLARKLRDKYRAMADRQKRELRGKTSPRAAARSTDNRNTRAKEQLFQETLDRYEAALAAAGSHSPKSESPARKKSAKPSPTKKPAPPKKKAVTVKSALKKKATTKKTSTKQAAASSLFGISTAGAAPPRKKSPARSAFFDSPAQRSMEKSLAKQSRASRGKRNKRLQQSAWTMRSVRSAAGKTRRRQAKRDAR